MSYAQCPTLVASETPVADEIRSVQKERFGQKLAACSYDHFRQHAAWHQEGVVLLSASSESEADAAVNVVREARLRRSPLTLAVLQNGAPEDVLAPLDRYIACRVPWPQGAGEVAKLIRSSQVAMAPEPLAETLAARLRWYTPSLLPQARRLAVAASHDISVLLTGETGTGKTFLARLLHEHSPRREHPFLTVPCGAQSPGLFESNFFGHVKGAFTGATQTRPGKFAAAGKGTILLDEIDTLGLEQQAGLLRVIETGAYELVGSNEPHRSEARIIVASNWDLDSAVAEGRFRQDLFYRLNVMAFHLPPLRERREDVLPLARSFAAHFNAKYEKGLFEIAPSALAALEAFHWPGNIRQLENVIQQAVLVSNGPELTVDDLPPLSDRCSSSACSNGSMASSGFGHTTPTHDTRAMGDTTLLRNRAAYERTLILQTLENCQYNRSSAARALGISRVTLYKKIKQYGLTDLPTR
ncbi:MAG: sigma-54 dependent transcriptional regulator [Gemmataceae bacterium]